MVWVGVGCDEGDEVESRDLDEWVAEGVAFELLLREVFVFEFGGES